MTTLRAMAEAVAAARERGEGEEDGRRKPKQKPAFAPTSEGPRKAAGGGARVCLPAPPSWSAVRHVFFRLLELARPTPSVSALVHRIILLGYEGLLLHRKV